MTAVQHPKVVVIGAGSLFFGRQAIWQMVFSEHLNTGTLALVDTDSERLERMTTLAEMVVADAGVSLKIESANNWKDVLPDADFVVLSFAEKTVYYRGIDCTISEKYGIRMCSGDTIGPGGIFRAMRELPVIMDCIRDIEQLCPDAWVINYINPSAVNGMALARYAPQVKSFALCDSLHMPHIKQRYAQRAGIIHEGETLSEDQNARFDMRITGVNHFTWMLKAEYDGENVMPNIAEAIRQIAATEDTGGDGGAKALYNNRIAHQLYEIFGYIPVCVAHTKEYMNYWQGKSILENDIPPLSIWETEDRYDRHDAMWKQVDSFIDSTVPIHTYKDVIGADHATDIIENMVGGLNKPFYVNVPNNGAVSNMNDDAFLELLCDIDMDGPKPRPVGEMPRGIRGMQEVILDVHELTAEAVVKGDYGLLRRAMLSDPLVTSIADADAILSELLEIERDILPDVWYS